MDTIPIELHIEILKRLHPNDRLSCRLVCKSWHSILTSVSTFKKDWQLTLTGTEKNPIDLTTDSEYAKAKLLNSDYKFHRLQLGSYIKFNTGFFRQPCFGQLMELSIDAEHIQVKNHESMVHEILVALPNLQRLSLKNISQDYFEETFFSNPKVLAELKTTGVLQNLEEYTINLQLIWSICMIGFFDPLAKLVELCPKLKRIRIENLAEDNNPQLMKFQQAHRDLAIDVTMIAKFSKIMQIYLIENYSREDYIKVETSIGVRYWEYFWKKAIRIKINNLDAKSYGIEAPWPTRCLVDMVHLEELEIGPVGTKCFFGHEVAMNYSVRQVDVSGCEHPCLSCIETVLKSFPNLRKLVHDSPSYDKHIKARVCYPRTKVVPYHLNYFYKPQ